MNETRPLAFDLIGFDQSNQRRGRCSPPLQDMALACRHAIGVLVLMIAVGTGCSRGPKDSARSGSVAGAISAPTSTLTSASAPPTKIADAHVLEAPIFRADDQRRKGVIQTDLISEGAVFRTADYNIVIVHVQSASFSNLVSRVESHLAASRRVVLDSDGDEQGKALVSDITRAVTGGGPETEGALISVVQEGVYAVAPLDTVATHRRRQTLAGKPLSAGNTARYALGID
jgi:hypothetical protein